VKSDLEPNIRERSLRAFLDLVMIRMLTQHSMSSYEINKALTKEFGVIIGPNTIYSKLYLLEKRGAVKCSKGRSGKVYSLTAQGHQIAGTLSALTEEICNSVKPMLSHQNNTK